MRTIRTALAAMIAALSLVAFESDADAQARREGTNVTRTNPSSSKSSRSTVSRQPSGRSSGTVSRSSSSSSDRKPAATRPSTQTRPSATRPSGQVRPSSNQNKPSGTSSRPSTGVSADRKPSTTVTRPASRPTVPAKPSGTSVSTSKPSASARPSAGKQPVAAKPSDKDFKVTDRNRPANVTRPGNTTRPADRPAVRPDAGPGNRPSARPDTRKPDRRPDRPVQIRPDHRPDVHRVHPRDRDFMVYSKPSYFWSHHNHCYGHRVRVLPSHVRRYIYYGVTYYCYNDIWYRPYAGYYIVCRPPRGTVLAANLIADMAWTAVRLSYYHTVANTYSTINENNEYIAEQNAIIAQNNATIAAQNQTIAMNQQLASQAYTLANELGLVQSYAAADGNYFYQDGVFYTMDADGEYKVILPPAGALVETLPEDYDMVTLKGEDYYKVDETVYKVTISDGKPYFEVLGQLYS